MMSTQDQEHDLPVYVRIGEAGEEYRIGTITIDNPASVAAAIVELFRAAAFVMEAETLAAPAKEADDE